MFDVAGRFVEELKNLLVRITMVPELPADRGQPEINAVLRAIDGHRALDKLLLIELLV